MSNLWIEHSYYIYSHFCLYLAQREICASFSPIDAVFVILLREIPSQSCKFSLPKCNRQKDWMTECCHIDFICVLSLPHPQQRLFTLVSIASKSIHLLDENSHKLIANSDDICQYICIYFCLMRNSISDHFYYFPSINSRNQVWWNWLCVSELAPISFCITHTYLKIPKELSKYTSYLLLCGYEKIAIRLLVINCVYKFWYEIDPFGRCGTRE